jgi:hypothetical protein
LPNSDDADDGLALNFGGSKRWLTPKTIKELANQCSISTKSLNAWETRIADALVETSKKVIEFLNENPDDSGASVAKRMLELWAIGLEAFDGEAAQRIKDLNS